MNKPRLPLQRQPGNLRGIAPSWQGHTRRQALEVSQQTERRAGVDAQSGSTEHWDVTGHLQQHLLREHSLCPPRPWEQQHHGHSHSRGESKGKPSAPIVTLAPQHQVLGTSYTLERELWNGFPYG